MNSSHIRNYLIATLADGKFHSGEKLGQKLGITRAAIAKHMRVLQTLGLDIFSVRGKGYRLTAPIALYDKSRLLQLLPEYAPEHLHVEHVISSTNDFLRSLCRTSDNHNLANGMVCVAEAQTAGRGRQGKSWFSPFGSSVYLSLLWFFEDGYQAISGLSLAIGVAVVRCLRQLGADSIQLKWPNDVFFDQKKLAGILIDVEGQLHGGCYCIIGIGLNVRLPLDVADISQPHTDLATVLSSVKTPPGDSSLDKNQLVAQLINTLKTVIQEYQSTGLAGFHGEWNDLDMLRDQAVRLVIGEKPTTGIERGINTAGGLLLEIPTACGGSQLKAFYGGEVSVRKI